MLAASWRALGTTVVVAVADDEALDAARSTVATEVDALDRACSRFRADSDLERLNAAGGAPVVVSALLGDAIRAALRAATLTDGDVDPTIGGAMAALGYDADFDTLPADGGPIADAVTAGAWRDVRIAGSPPMVTVPAGVRLDLGATAKALGADRAAAAAHAAAGCAVLVSLGGDLAIAGGAPAGGWPVRVTDDHAAPAGAPGQTIVVHGGGLATSSSTVRRWRRGTAVVHHIVDPRTGWPAQSPYRTVSVAAATCVDANIATTAAIVRGTRAVSWLESLGLPARLVAQDGRVVELNGWPAAELAA